MYQITKDMIEEQFEGCLYCGEPQGDKFGCCQENHFGTITLIDSHFKKDVDNNFIQDSFLIDDDFNIVEHNDLSIQEKNDVLGGLERDIKGDR